VTDYSAALAAAAAEVGEAAPDREVMKAAAAAWWEIVDACSADIFYPSVPPDDRYAQFDRTRANVFCYLAEFQFDQ
jgi:hypothetical protein